MTLKGKESVHRSIKPILSTRHYMIPRFVVFSMVEPNMVIWAAKIHIRCSEHKGFQARSETVGSSILHMRTHNTGPLISEKLSCEIPTCGQNVPQAEHLAPRAPPCAPPKPCKSQLHPKPLETKPRQVPKPCAKPRIGQLFPNLIEPYLLN